MAGVVLLALGTALIHLFLGLQVPGALGASFVLNFFGYVGLVALLYLPVPGIRSYQPYVRYALIGYTALTIVLWIAFGTKYPLGYADKVIEVGLIALLVIEDRLARR